MRSDERAQSVQIGAVLLFAALILALAGYQAFVVPQQNEQVEFSHSQTVQNQLTDLRNTLVSVPGESSARSVGIQLGTRYPARLITVNPGPPTGNLRTVGTTDGAVAFEVVNAQSEGETGDYWTGTDDRTYETGTLAYRPNYNVYGGAPTTTYENSVLVNRFPSGHVALTDQSIVDGNSVNLVALDGHFDRTGAGSQTVDVRPASASTTTVSVTNPDPSSRVTLRFPTRLDEETWQSLLDDQTSGPDGHVASVSVTPGSPFNTLAIELETGETYSFRMAKAGVGSDVSDEGRAYLTDVAGDGASIAEGGRSQVVLAVRDAFNNPVSGVTVDAEVDGPGTLIAGSDTTGDDGRATFTYDAPDDVDGGPESATIDASYENLPSGGTFDADATQDASLSVTVMNSDGSGSSSGGADAAYQTTWQDPSAQSGVSCDPEGDDCTVDADSTTQVTLTAQTVPEAVDAEVLFARNRTDRSSLSATSPTTDSDGLAQTTFSVTANGETKVYAASGGSGDAINLTVENYSPEMVDFRVDDISHADTSENRFIASYDATSIANADSVEVTFDPANDPTTTLTDTTAPFRGNFTLQESRSSDDYEVSVSVLDSSGSVITEETISDSADGLNPTGQNEQITGGATLSSYDIDDRSNNGNPVRYRLVDFQISGSDYSKIKFFAVPIADGDSNDDDAMTNTGDTSGNNVDISGGYTNGGDYRVGILVFDGDGAVVQAVSARDAPGGGSDVVSSSLALLAFVLGVSHLRRGRDG